jgi:hypothetical protein
MWNDRQLDLLIICVESVIQVHFAGPPSLFPLGVPFHMPRGISFFSQKKSEERNSVIRSQALNED